MRCRDLSLLIVDEEHRFGVRQKETIKRLRADVDILTLPQPDSRTLNMAMNNIRISIIATPPASVWLLKPSCVNTTNRRYEKPFCVILRGGQMCFLHNNVETIEKTARDIEELVPEARVTLDRAGRELEQIMSDFYAAFNVLVCTTIIETGIDMPANTIIWIADHLGLRKCATSWPCRTFSPSGVCLFDPSSKPDDQRRSEAPEAISQLEDLGAGFMLATESEIRGAGSCLATIRRSN